MSFAPERLQAMSQEELEYVRSGDVEPNHNYLLQVYIRATQSPLDGTHVKSWITATFIDREAYMMKFRVGSAILHVDVDDADVCKLIAKTPQARCRESRSAPIHS